MSGNVKQRAIGWVAGLIHLGFFARYALFVPFLLVLLTLLGWQYRTNTILGNVFLVDSPSQLFQLAWLSLVAVAPVDGRGPRDPPQCQGPVPRLPGLAF